MQNIKNLLKRMATRHRQGPEKNIFIFSTARSGTTWLAEMIATQGRFKIVNEPFNLRVPVKRDNLGIATWNDLFDPRNKPVLRSYISSFINGRDRDLRFGRPSPFSHLWHYRTDRIIFKILFAGEDCINWFRDTFNGQIIFLLRHPIPVALSRKKLPRLQSFLESPYATHFTTEQLEYAKSIVRINDEFEVSVLDWCLQNAVPIRSIEADWIVISYEQMVLQPEVVVNHLVQRLSLGSAHKMMQQVYKASGSTGHSSAESRRALTDPEQIHRNRSPLVRRWRETVSDVQEGRAFEILQQLGMDCYERGRDTPIGKYWLGPNS